MTITNKEATVKFNPRFQGLGKADGYDVLKYVSGCDKNMMMSQRNWLGEKKKDLRLRELSEIFHDSENSKDKMLKANSNLKRMMTVCQGIKYWYILQHDEPWNIRLSERSQSQKTIYSVIPLMWNV